MDTQAPSGKASPTEHMTGGQGDTAAGAGAGAGAGAVRVAYGCAAAGSDASAHDDVAEGGTAEPGDDDLLPSVVPSLLDLCTQQLAVVVGDAVADAEAVAANTATVRALVHTLPAHLTQSIVTHLYQHGQLNDTLFSCCLVPDLEELNLVPLPSGATPQELSPSVLCAAGNDCAKLRALRLRESEMDDGRLGLLVSSLSGALEVLDLRMCMNVSSATVSTACTANRNTLKHLDVGWCCRPSLGGQALANLARCSALTTLVLSGHPNLEFEDLRALGSLTNLRTLALKGCSGVTEVASRWVTGLTALNLSGVPISSGTLARVLKATPDTLQVLKLAESQISPRIVNAYLNSKTLPLQLTSLDLSWCDNASEDCVVKLCCACPRLNRLRLRLSAITDSGCQSILKACPLLVKLILPRCSSLTDASLKTAAAHCRLLEHVDVSWCSGVSEVGVGALLKACGRLRKLKLEGCKAISAAVVDVFDECALKLRLRLLDLAWVNSASSELVWDILLRCPWLVVIDYYREEFRIDDVPNDYAGRALLEG